MLQDLLDHGRVFDACNDFDVATAVFTLLDINVEDTLEPLHPGHRIEISDAEQAYTQAKLGGTQTWVRLPKERWPKHWAVKYRDPVVLLVLALCGPPESGG